MASWLEEYDYYGNYEEEYSNDKITWTQKTCFHNWKCTQLIISTVYDCTKCNVKKEDYEEWSSKKGYKL